MQLEELQQLEARAKKIVGMEHRGITLLHRTCIGTTGEDQLRHILYHFKTPRLSVPLLKIKITSQKAYYCNRYGQSWSALMLTAKNARGLQTLNPILHWLDYASEILEEKNSIEDSLPYVETFWAYLCSKH